MADNENATGELALKDLGLNDQQGSALEAAGLTTVDLIRQEFAKEGQLQHITGIGESTESLLVEKLSLTKEDKPASTGSDEPKESNEANQEDQQTSEDDAPVEPEPIVCLGVYMIELPGCLFGRQLVYCEEGPEEAFEIYKKAAGVTSHLGRPLVSETPIDPKDQTIKDRLLGRG